MKLKFLIMSILSLAFISSCSEKEVSNKAFVLDTIITINIYDTNITQKEKNKLIEESIEICKDYEQKLSKTISNNEVYLLNNSNGNSVTVSDNTLFLIKNSLYYSDLSDGAFDITVKPLIDLWDIKSENPTVPNYTDIKNALESVDYKNIEITNNSVTLKNGSQIDFGGIAKGYISDKIKEYLLDNGCNSAVINLGGNVVTIGEQEDGSSWKVGLQKPFSSSGEVIAVINIIDKSVVTSGAYERYFEKDGKVYHHIIDPKTGYPSTQELNSVTIISDKSIDGDALSTSCFVLGLEKGMLLLENIDNVDGIFINNNNEVFTTSGEGKTFSLDLLEK